MDNFKLLILSFLKLYQAAPPQATTQELYETPCVIGKDEGCVTTEWTPTVKPDIHWENLTVERSDKSRQQIIESFTFNKNNDPINKYDDFAGMLVWDAGNNQRNWYLDDEARYFRGNNDTGPLEEAKITAGHIYIRQTNLDCSFFDKRMVGNGIVHSDLAKYLFRSMDDTYQWRKFSQNENGLLAGFSIRQGKLSLNSAWFHSRNNRNFYNSQMYCDGSDENKTKRKHVADCEASIIYRVLEQFLKDGQKKFDYDVDEISFVHADPNLTSWGKGYDMPFVDDSNANVINENGQVDRVLSDYWYPVARQNRCV